MNRILLKYYMKTGNSSKIKSLSSSEYEKFYNSSSLVDKIKLSHLRGGKLDLESFDLMVNGRSINELLDDKNNIMFYLELLNYINSDVMFNGEYIKRFNIPLWKNRLEESGFFHLNDIYSLIEKNIDFFIDLLDNNEYYRGLFFKNVSFEGNMYEIAINRILSYDKLGVYLASQKEMFKFYNKRCSSMLFSLDKSFFENLPDEYKFLIGYHVRPDFGNDTSNNRFADKIRDVLIVYFPFLSFDEIEDILSLYSSNVSGDNIASMISFIIEDHDFYSKYRYLCDTYFDGDSEKTIFFCRKYKGTKLFEELCFNDVPNIKEKIIFLSFANRLKGISSLDDLMDKSLEDLKNTSNDYSSYRDVRDDVRAFGKNDFICLNYEREIILIYPDGTIDEREAKESHDQILKEFILDNGYNYDGPIVFRNMVLVLAEAGNTILLIEGDNVVCTIPDSISNFQKQSLKELFRKMNSKSEISLCIAEDGQLYALNNGDTMNSELASSELSRVKSK